MLNNYIIVYIICGVITFASFFGFIYLNKTSKNRIAEAIMVFISVISIVVGIVSGISDAKSNDKPTTPTITVNNVGFEQAQRIEPDKSYEDDFQNTTDRYYSLATNKDFEVLLQSNDDSGSTNTYDSNVLDKSSLGMDVKAYHSEDLSTPLNPNGIYQTQNGIVAQYSNEGDEDNLYYIVVTQDSAQPNSYDNNDSQYGDEIPSDKVMMLQNNTFTIQINELSIPFNPADYYESSTVEYIEINSPVNDSLYDYQSVNFYEFTVDNATEVSLHFMYAAPNTNLDYFNIVLFYDDPEEEISSFAINGLYENQVKEHIPLNAGVYHLMIYSNSDNYLETSYSLSVETSDFNNTSYSTSSNELLLPIFDYSGTLDNNYDISVNYGFDVETEAYFNISLSSSINDIGESLLVFVILDNDGNEIYRTTNNPNDSESSIDSIYLDSGSYTIVISNEGNITTDYSFSIY